MSTTPGLKDALQWVQGSNPNFDTSSFLRNPYNSAAVGGIAGAGIGGLLSGGLASTNKKKNESKENRRKRIMRQALLGAGLGGVAGASVGPVSNFVTGANAPDNQLDQSIADLVGKTESATGKKQPGLLGSTANSVLRAATLRGGLGEDHADWDRLAALGGGAAAIGGTYAGMRNVGRGAVANNMRTQIEDLRKGFTQNGMRPADTGSRMMHDALEEIVHGRRGPGGHSGMEGALNDNQAAKAWNNANRQLSNLGQDIMNGTAVRGTKLEKLRDAIVRSQGIQGDANNRAQDKALRETLINVFGVKPSAVDQALKTDLSTKIFDNKNIDSKRYKALAALRGMMGRRFFRSRWRAPSSSSMPMKGIPGLVGQTAAYGTAAVAPSVGLDAFRHFKPYDPGPDMNKFIKDVQTMQASGADIRQIEESMRQKGYPDEWVNEATDISRYANQ